MAKRDVASCSEMHGEERGIFEKKKRFDEWLEREELIGRGRVDSKYETGIEKIEFEKMWNCKLFRISR